MNLDYLGLSKTNVKYNLSYDELTKLTLDINEGELTSNNTLNILTGKFTGRSPLDRFVVRTKNIENKVDWGEVNIPISIDHYNQLEKKILDYLEDKTVFVRDSYVCSDAQYRLNVRTVCEKPWSSIFANNMFLRCTEEELKTFSPDWHVICAPEFEGDPTKDGIRQENFAIINFEKKRIIIGGTGYTGEMKKGIFSVLNCILPTEHDVLAMHCSANVGENNDTAIFFGLSGTGKTTLSASADRKLIGDDEHGWSKNGVFNFEGGCYAKCIDLSETKEPEIFHAIKPGALLENVIINKETHNIDFSDDSITQNTRVSYPIYHIDNVQPNCMGDTPKNIFLLTADAFGVLPPISKLTNGQAMYHFISGYTAKVAGTEEGVTEPQSTFSACFGAPFLPLHPTFYAKMLGDKIHAHKVNVWLVNTGWTGGSYGIGSRIKLKYTRAMVQAALDGGLSDVAYEQDEIFGLQMPMSCPGVPSDILNPINTWENHSDYRTTANQLANEFQENFEQFSSEADQEIIDASPKAVSIVD